MVTCINCLRSAGVEWAIRSPLVDRALVTDAMLRLVQVVNELTLVVLTSNYALLGTSHTWCKQFVGSSLLWRSIRLRLAGESAHHNVRQNRLGSQIRGTWEIWRLILVLFSMQKHGFEAKRFALKSAIRYIVVGRCVIHQVFNRRFRLVAIENGFCLLGFHHVRHQVVATKLDHLGCRGVHWHPTWNLLLRHADRRLLVAEVGLTATLDWTRQDCCSNIFHIPLVLLEFPLAWVSLEHFLDLLEVCISWTTGLPHFCGRL